jgi:hypothetical protein
MTTKPTLLKEAIAALKAVKALNFATDPTDDAPMHRAFKRVGRVLNKATKLEAA